MQSQRDDGGLQRVGIEAAARTEGGGGPTPLVQKLHRALKPSSCAEESFFGVSEDFARVARPAVEERHYFCTGRGK
jgi:hypothetical protein